MKTDSVLPVLFYYDIREQNSGHGSVVLDQYSITILTSFNDINQQPEQQLSKALSTSTNVN